MKGKQRTLLQQFIHGTPRESWQASKQLRDLSDDDVSVLHDLLRKDIKVLEILEIVGNNRISSKALIETIVGKVASGDERVRIAAVQALLHASPKLKQHMGQLQQLYENEPNTRVKLVLERLVKRFSD